MEAEYENWLRQEMDRCGRVEELLGDGGNKGKGDVESWAKAYCGDCESALGGIRGKNTVRLM